MDTFLDFIKNNPEQVNTFVAICALIISLVSIMLTFISLWMQRVHNFKSVTPIASIPIGDYENMIEVKLRNTGVGPLMVEKFLVYQGKKTKNNIIDWMPDPPNGMQWETFYNDLTDLCIPPGDTANLIRLSGNPNNQKFSRFRNKVRQALAALRVQVEYKDIYNRKMPIKERDLSWFGRHQVKNNLENRKSIKNNKIKLLGMSFDVGDSE